MGIFIRILAENMPSPPSSPSIVGEQEVGVEALMERMKRLSEKSESYQITQEELSKRFETVETQSAELAAAPQRSSSVLDSDIGHFIEDPTFIYQDFAKVSVFLIHFFINVIDAMNIIENGLENLFIIINKYTVFPNNRLSIIVDEKKTQKILLSNVIFNFKNSNLCF